MLLNYINITLLRIYLSLTVRQIFFKETCRLLLNTFLKKICGNLYVYFITLDDHIPKMCDHWQGQ